MSTLGEEKETVDFAPFGAARVSFERFRNYASLQVDLSEGFNILAGPNAQGKTNFLEGLYLLSTSRLLRGQKDAEAIQHGHSRAKVQADLLGASTTLSMTLEKGIRKRAALNGLGLPRASDVIGRMPCVCVSAADMEIARGEPAERRMFLDLELSALFSAYLNHLAHYKRALDHRNALLRQHAAAFASSSVPDSVAAEYEPWEEQIALHGEAIRESRDRYVDELRPLAADVHSRMADGESLALRYVTRDEARSADQMRDALAQNRRVDSFRGGTGVGPHRDDVLIEVEGREARLFASQGQQRTAVISIKLGSLAKAREVLRRPPLLLLDDILSDLDERRRACLVEVALDAAGQAVLTCTEARAAGQDVLRRARLFRVSEGAVCDA